MAIEHRHVYGPRPIGALLPAITRTAFRRRSPAAAQVLSDWSSIVGPAIAAVTVPRRLVSGTLTLACSGPIATELQHLSGELISRINAHLGAPTVRDVRFVQTAPAAAPKPRPGRTRRDQTNVADAAVVGLPSGELRDALVALGRVMFSGQLSREREQS